MMKRIRIIISGTIIFVFALKGLVAQAPVYCIGDSITVDKPVSPLLYGSFIELGFGWVENLRAEMLYNRSFEEDTPHTPGWVEFTRPSKEEEDWWHSGYEQQPWYLLRSPDDTLTQIKKIRNYWPACHSRTNISITSKPGVHPVYWAQDGIYLRKNTGYRFSGYFCTGRGVSAYKYTESPVDIQIVLYAEKDTTVPIAEQTLRINTLTFNRYELEFPPVNYEGRATFAVKIPPGVRIGFDFLSLMPSDNVKGWRKDVLDLINSRLPVPVLRFPGGCYASFYHWRDGIGDPYYRPVNLTSFWTSPVINDIGTIEFVEFCREIHAEPLLCVPLMVQPLENTLDWLTFCNAPVNELRARYGHPEPFNIKYWELENEMYRTMDAITYAHKCVEFSTAMKAIDPTIKTIMGDYWVYNSRLKEMLEIAGPYIDLVNNRGGDIKEQASDMEVIGEYNRTHNRSIRMCYTEFRAPLERMPEVSGADELNRVKRTSPESLQNMSVRWSFGMSVLEQYIRYQNFGGGYAFLNFTSLNDTWGENLINIPNEGAFLSSAGMVHEFLSGLPISYPLFIADKSEDPDIVIQAAWDEKKAMLTLLILNFSGNTKSCKIDLSRLNTKFSPVQKHMTVYANDSKEFNSPAGKNKIIRIDDQSKIQGKRCNVLMKPFSANAWIFTVVN